MNRKTNMKELKEDEFLCLSFNNFGLLSDIAAKISDEFQAEENHNEEDFEFSLVSENSDKFIYDDQNKFQQPIFPLFNRDLLLSSSDLKDVDKSILIPLKKLFLENSESKVSSEAEELETIHAGNYCRWKPKISESLPGKCNKSKSTGSVSKRWPRIRDLLRRSNSEGQEKDSFVCLKPKTKNSSEVVNTAGKLKQTKPSGGKKDLPPVAASQQALYYARNRADKEGDKNKRKSYLPYRKELIGFFAISLSRS